MREKKEGDTTPEMHSDGERRGISFLKMRYPL